MADVKAAWIGAIGAIVAALIGAYAVMTPSPAVPGAPGETDRQPPRTLTQVVMSQLEIGINRQGMDFNDQGRYAPNAETCAEFCRQDDACKAMTFVISRQTCWLKAGEPAPFPPGGPDFVSAVKRMQ